MGHYPTANNETHIPVYLVTLKGHGPQAAHDLGSRPQPLSAQASNDLHWVLQAMHAFRDNAATLLLATGSASRGLDLPGVTHIVNLGVPSSAVEYLHRAGRVGRLGSLSPGQILG